MADRFWVGGTGTWSAANTANWAATSGGAGGASVPTAADTVTFNAASGTSFTVTVAADYSPTVTSVTGGAATVALNLNNRTLTTGTFNFTGTAVRTLAFGTTGAIDITGNAATVWETSTTTNLTVTGTPVCNLTYSGATGTRTLNISASAAEAQSILFNVTAGTDTITTSASAAVGGFDFTGFSGTLAAATRVSYGSITLSATMTVTASTAVTLFLSGSAAGTKTLTSNGCLFPNLISYNPTGSKIFQLVDNWAGSGTTNAAYTFTHTSGTLDLNGKTFATGAYISTGSTARTITGAGATIDVTGINATIVNTALTGFTITGRPTLKLSGAGTAGQTKTVTLAAFTENNGFSVWATAGVGAIALGGSMENLDTTGFTGNLTNLAKTIYGNLTLGTGTTITTAGVGLGFTLASTSGTVRTITTNAVVVNAPIIFNGVGGSWRFESDFTAGTASTNIMTLTNGSVDFNGKTISIFAFASNNSNVRTINQNGGTWNITGFGATIWDTATVTNLTTTGVTINCTYNLGTQSTFRTFNMGAISEANQVNVNVVEGNDLLSMNGNFGSINLTGFRGALVNSARTIYGNLTLGASMLAAGQVVNASANTTFAATSGTKTITSNGVKWPVPSIFGSGASTATWTLADELVMETAALTNAKTLTLNTGTFTANNKNVILGAVSSSGTGTRALVLGSGTWNVDGTGTVWDFSTSTNATLTANTANIVLRDTSTANRTFASGGLTYANLIIGGNTGVSNTTFTGNAVFNGALSSTKTVAHGVLFTAGTTTTMGDWQITGTAVNVVTVNSVGNTAQHFLTKTGGGAITTVDYLNITNSYASPIYSTWNPGANSIDGGNNVGWFNNIPATSSSNFFLVF